MNILDQSSIHNCTSCGVCAAVCAREAIKIQLDKDGFYRPMIEESHCNGCGLCVSVCYRFDHEVRMTAVDELNKKPLYSAWSKDDFILNDSTSGGIGDLLAHQLMSEGYKVVGVIYDLKPDKAVHKIAENEDELSLFRGSKYIQSYTYDAFKEVVANCRNEKFAVFGTPCQIYALNRLTTQRGVRDNFVFIDLYCHGCPSIFAWSKCLDDFKQKNGVETIDRVVFRSKINGWGSFYVVVVVVKGESYYISGKLNDKFYELFFSDQILNEACHDCKLRSTLDYTDIRLGDFWGNKYLNNHKGVSAVVVSSQKGVEVFKKIKEKIVCERCDYSDFHPWQSWGKNYEVNGEMRNMILNSLRNPDENSDDAIKAKRSKESIASTMQRIAKSILSYLPSNMLQYAKRIKYSLMKRIITK